MKHFYRKEEKTEEFSALLFHHRNIKMSDLPVKRKEDQLYIYFNLESPAQFVRPDFKSLKNFFNLSMNFRLNADIHVNYGGFVQVAQHSQSHRDLNQIITNFGAANTQLARKEKGKYKNEALIAQFASNCNSIREG